MRTYRRTSEPLRSPSALREVYVARTVREPQRGFERFLNSFGRRLGAMAMVNIHTIGSTHLTFLESRGVSGQFDYLGYGPHDIRAFKGELEQHLKRALPDQRARVEVDSEEPLKWMAGGALALNIVEDELLTQERDKIEEFLTDHFGEMPGLWPFSPHITIGRLTEDVPLQERDDPMSLVPNGLRIPETIVLNGLETYLGRFQPDTKVC